MGCGGGGGVQELWTFGSNLLRRFRFERPDPFKLLDETEILGMTVQPNPYEVRVFTRAAPALTLSATV